MAYKNKILRNPKTGQDIKFLQTATETQGKLLEIESTFHPHSQEPPAHYHPYQIEDFSILQGELTVRIAGQIQVLKEGETLHIPKRTIHSMWNNSEQKTVVNWKVQPAMNTAHLLETNIGLVNEGKTTEAGRPHILQIALMLNKYAPVFRLAKPSYLLQKIIFTILSPFAYLLGYRATYERYLD